MKKGKLLVTSIAFALAGVGAVSCLSGCGKDDGPETKISFSFSIGLKSGKSEFRVNDTDQIVVYDNGVDTAGRSYKYYSSKPEAAVVDENTGAVSFKKVEKDILFFVKEAKVSNPAQTVRPVSVITNEVSDANGGFNFASSSGKEAIEKRTEILGKLEKYVMDSHLTGITLFDNGGLVRYSDRVNLPTGGKYVTGYGFGLLTEGTLDPNKPLTGDDGKKNPDYLHSSIAQDSLKINQYTATGSQVSDLAGYITSSYWGARLKGTDGYEWYPSLAADKVKQPKRDAEGKLMYDTDGKTLLFEDTADDFLEPIHLEDDNKLGMYKKWRIYVKTDNDVNHSVLKFHQKLVDGKNIVSGPYDNEPVTIEDYVFPYKMLFTGSNALIRGTEMANDTSYGIKGAARYFSDTQSELSEDAINTKWNTYYGGKLGLKGGTDDVNGSYLDIELINAIDPFTAMYTLSSSLVSPLKESMFMGANAIVPNNFKKSATAYGTFNNEPEPANSKILKYTLSCGPFVLTKWDKNQQIVFARNDDWFEYKNPVSGQLTGRYNIPGINYRVYDVSQNPEKTWDQFELSNLDSVGVPTKKVAEWRGKPGIYETEGDSTFKLNVNSCTQEQWDAFNTKEWHNQPGSWDVKPWMSNSNFLDGLFYSIDRKQFAEKRGVKPSINYFSDSYMSDPQNVLGQGGSYNATEAHKEAVKGYETIDENGNSDYGYDFDKALSCFRNAVKELSDQNKIALGTKENPTEIHIHIRWMYQTDEKEYGEDIKYYFEKAFNDDAVCGGKVKLVVDQEAVTNWEDVYNVWMMKGKFDLGFGAISGNSFNPLNFMEVLKSDNSSSFTLNWGASTSQIDPVHPIVYDDGTGAKEWSYDGLWEVADHGGILNKGVKVDPVKSCKLGDTTRGGVGIADYYNGDFDLEIPISFTTFSSEVDNVEFDVNRVDAYCYGKGNVTLGEKSESTLVYDKANKVIKIHVSPEVAKDVNDQIIAGQHFTPQQQEEDPAKYKNVFTDAYYTRYYDFEVYFSIIIGETATENFVTVKL
ncbi:MAG: hypothetical protein KBS97_02575 [Firmicutes bacterium]|nr:hypothetical protein [Candidatus Fiminaster equi]